MRGTGYVTEALPDGTARVRLSSGGCGGCAGCPGAAACARPVLTVRNPVGAREGDRVAVDTRSGGAYMASLCLVPVLTFAAALWVTDAAGGADALAAAVSVGAFLAGALAVLPIRRAILAKRAKTAAIIEVLI